MKQNIYQAVEKRYERYTRTSPRSETEARIVADLKKEVDFSLAELQKWLDTVSLTFTFLATLLQKLLKNSFLNGYLLLFYF